MSKHLFWDTPINTIDLGKNKGFIVQRVMGYGLMNNWNLIKKWFGINAIGTIATQFRSLDSKASAFLVNITGLPINNFNCYTTKQLTKAYWDY